MPTTASPAEIREDFDAMAPLMPDRLGPHEAWLLAQLPRRHERALEIGCGAGTVARHLAESFAHVDAIDFSPAMIAEAKRRTPASIAQSLRPGGRLLALDVMRQPNPFIAAVAMLLGFRWRSWKLRLAFWRHGRNETYLTMDDARRIASEALPGAQVRAHFFFRYSIIWEAA